MAATMREIEAQVETPVGPRSGGNGDRIDPALVVGRVRAIVANAQPVSRAIAAALVGGWVLQLLIGDAFRKQLALVPARVIPKFWMPITAGLVEMNFMKLVIDLVALFSAGNLIEPLWGWKELIKFLTIINSVSFGAIMITYIFLYIAFTKVTLLYARLGGFGVSISGLLVGLKQALPEEELEFKGVGIRFKYLPLIYLGTCLLLSGIFSDGSYFLMALYGTFFSWFYIRYYQRRPESGATGDQSDSFRLVTLFPESTHSTLEQLSGKATSILKRGPASVPASYSSVVSMGGDTGTDDPEAARRRERGARALEERLSGKATPG